MPKICFRMCSIGVMIAIYIRDCISRQAKYTFVHLLKICGRPAIEESPGRRPRLLPGLGEGLPDVAVVGPALPAAGGQAISQVFRIAVGHRGAPHAIKAPRWGLCRGLWSLWMADQ